MKLKLCALLLASRAIAKIDKDPKHLRHGHRNQHEHFSVSEKQSREVQHEVERMVGRMNHLDDGAAVAQFANELNTVELAQEALAEEAGDKKLVKEIDSTRADLCLAKGFAAHEFEACEGFMRAGCDSSVAPEHKVPHVKCTQFFQAEQKAVVEGLAPAAAPSGAPGGPSAPGPALFGGKKYVPLPEQGVSGKKVLHKDFDTMTGDWHVEFGPKAGHRSYFEICADHPNNEWCCLHGYCPTSAPTLEKGIIEEIVEEVKKIVSPAPSPPAPPPADTSAGDPPVPPAPKHVDHTKPEQAEEEPTPFIIPTTTPSPWLFPWAQFLLFLLILAVGIAVCLNICGR